MDKKVWNLRKNLKQVAKAAGFKSAHKFCCNERKRNCHLDDSCYSGTVPKKTNTYTIFLFYQLLEQL